MKKNILITLVTFIIFSCNNEDIIQKNTELIEKLELKKINLTKNDIDNIKLSTKPIYFANIDEAKTFLNHVQNDFQKIGKEFEYLKRPSIIYSPCNKRGSILVSSKNMSINLHLNVRFDYVANGEKIDVRNIKSNLTGFTLGLSYEHESSSYSIENNKIRIKTFGIMNYNIFVEGIGTIYRQNVTIDLLVDPCSKQGTPDHIFPTLH